MNTAVHKHRLLKIFCFLLLSVGVLLLGACGAKEGEPTCDRGALVSPENLRPGGSPDHEGEMVDSLTPTFSWTYPDSTCLPEYYRLLLATNWHALETSPDEYRVDGWDTDWTPATELLPGTTYLWRVQAGSSWETAGGRIGIFRTGPLCDITSPVILSTPVPLWPADGAIVEGVNLSLEWDDPTDCIPDGRYVVEISERSDFSDALVGMYPEPYLFIAHPWVDFDLEECTRYFWRVHFDHASRPDADDGPTSEVWSFLTTTTTGAFCPPELLEGYIPEAEVTVPPSAEGAISGHVWHDECAPPYWSTDTPPAGCVAMPYGGFEANGVLDPGESGIEGVTVRLGTGACPVMGGRTATTDASGTYSFDSLPPGTYCVSIDALGDGNDLVLIPGNWTFPERWYGPDPIDLELSLGALQILREINFAWDYQFLPAPSIPTPTPSAAQGCWVWNPNLQKDVCTVPCPPNPQPGGACTP
jgi:hypothetical protein